VPGNKKMVRIISGKKVSPFSKFSNMYRIRWGANLFLAVTAVNFYLFCLLFSISTSRHDTFSKIFLLNFRHAGKVYILHSLSQIFIHPINMGKIVYRIIHFQFFKPTQSYVYVSNLPFFALRCQCCFIKKHYQIRYQP